MGGGYIPMVTQKSLNPWDVQSKHIAPENGIAESLYSGECRGGGGESYVMQTEQKCYGIGSYASNAMKSNNPHSGIYEADTSRTLDLNGGNPGCNQGGMAVVCIEGNGARESHQGAGFKESDTMYTLNTVEQHSVCVSAGFKGGQSTGGIGYEEEKSPTLNSQMSALEPTVCVSQNAYDKYEETDKGASLKASGGNYGGGYREPSDTVGALCARDFKGVGNQYVNEGKLIVDRC